MYSVTIPKDFNIYKTFLSDKKCWFCGESNIIKMSEYKFGNNYKGFVSNPDQNCKFCKNHLFKNPN